MLAAVGVMFLAAAPIKVAVPGFTYSGLERALGNAWVDHFVTLLTHEGGLEIITSNDIAQVLGIERQKQLLGCADDGSSCLTELAGALDSDVILTGNIVRAGSGFLVTLRLVGARDGKPLYTASKGVRDAEALEDWLAGEAHHAASQLRDQLRGGGPGVLTRLSPGIAGVLLGAVGGTLYAFSLHHASALAMAATNPDTFSSMSAIQSSASNGRLLEGSGFALMITAGVAIVASIIWLAVGAAP
jgi:hypothetical protein